MSIYLDICGTKKTVKNTGSKEECLYSPTVGYALAKEDQSFADIAAFKTKAAWDAAKQAKDVAIMFSVEASELANTEPSFYESRTIKYRNKRARKGINFTHHLGLCSHAALASYEGSEYVRIYEFTEDGNIKGILQDDGTVKGQSLSNFLVGQIEEPVIEGDPQKTMAEVVYKNYKQFENGGCIVEPDFDVEDYTGIFEVLLTVVGTPTATELVVRATAGCSGDIPVEGLTLSDFNVLLPNGTAQTPDSVTPGSGDDANLYTFVDTDLATGTVGTVVVDQSGVMYEAAPVNFTV